jgi:hypothetical protein
MRHVVWLAVCALALLGVPVAQSWQHAREERADTTRLSGPARNHALNAYRRLPLAFEPNRGQAGRGIAFVAHPRGYSLALTRRSALLALYRTTPRRGSRPSVRRLAISFAHESSHARLVAGSRLRGKVSYLTGRDRLRWHTGIPTFGDVAYRAVWPGIDASLGGSSGTIEFVYTVAPHADARRIVLSYRAASRITLDRHGNLVVSAGRGRTLRQLAPQAYQRIAGRRRSVAVRYVVRGTRVSLALGVYDRSRRLVIDPYVTYLGGGGASDAAYSVSVDTSGNAYVAGVAPAGFPTTAGAYQTTDKGNSDAVVSKIAPSGGGGADLLYSTYIGGTENDKASAVAVDGSGSAYVTGSTSSSDFPTTTGAYQTSYPMGAQGAAYFAKLSPSGNGASDLAYSTFFGAIGGAVPGTGATAIAVDGSGRAYLAGQSTATGLPTTAGAYQTTPAGAGDSFVAKLNPAGGGASDLLYSTWLGSTAGNDAARAIAVDATGHPYVTGWTSSSNFPTTTGAFRTSAGGGRDAFVTKLNLGGHGASDLAYSTYLGGSGGDEGGGIAVDSAGHVYVGGETLSSNYPTTSGAAQTAYAGVSGDYDAVMTKVDPGGHGASDLLYSTYLGGTSDDSAQGIAIDAAGDAYLTGLTSSSDYPTTTNAYQRTYGGGGAEDAFVARIHPGGQGGKDLAYSTYLGGSGYDGGLGVAVSRPGDAFAVGYASSGFPTTAGAFHTTLGGTGDAFLAELSTPSSTQRSTTTSVSCTPSTLITGQSTTCTAIVDDADSGTKQAPTGSISFSDTGSSTGKLSCTLAADGIAGESKCAATITPTTSGTPTIRADFGGEATHSASHGSTPLTVNPIPAHFRFSSATYSVGEGGGTATITIQRVGDTSRPASVDFATSDGSATAGSDYSPASGSKSFAIGDTTKTFTVSITDDNQPENDETVDLALTSLNPDVVIDNPGSATLTIADNDFGLSITGGPDGPTKQATPTFSFTTDPAIGPVDTCWIDSGTPAACDSTYTSAPLSDGSHTFHVSSTLSGATRTAARDFFVDTVAPAAKLGTAASTPGGRLVGPGAVYAGYVVIKGSASDPAPSSGVAGVRCVLDPASPPASYADISSVTCGGTTNAPGTHTAYYAVEDAALNRSAVVSTTFTILKPPETTITSGPSGATWDTTPRFTFASDIPGSTFQCRVDGDPWGACSSPYTTKPLGLYGHSFLVKASSPAGVEDPTPARADFDIQRTIVRRDVCDVDPFRVPDGNSQLGCGWGPTCPGRVHCGVARPTCPATALCTITMVADFADKDPFVTPPETTSGTAGGAGGGTRRGNGYWDVNTHIGFALVSGTGHCYATATDHSARGCDAAQSFKFIGAGKSIGLYCVANDWDSGAGTVWGPPRAGEFGPDSDRSLRCKATMSTTAATALELAGVAANNSLDCAGLACGLYLYVPNPGSAFVTGDVPPVQGLRSGLAARRRTPSAFAPVHLRASHGGPAKFKLRLTRAAARTLKRRHKLNIRIHVSYTPKHGRRLSRTHKLTLRTPVNAVKAYRARFRAYCRKHARLRHTPACRRALRH